MGFLDGVTTNPSLVAKEKKDYPTVVREICSYCKRTNKRGSPWLGLRFHDQGSPGSGRYSPQCSNQNTHDEVGLKAIKTLAGENIRTNATLIFSAAQALLAARAGASFVSPFLGRVDDNGNDGLILLDEIVTIFNQFAVFHRGDCCKYKASHACR